MLSNQKQPLSDQESGMKNTDCHLSLDGKHLSRVLLVRLCKPVGYPETGEAEGVPDEGYGEEERSSNDGPVHHCLAGLVDQKQQRRVLSGAAAGTLCFQQTVQDSLPR